MAASKPIPVFTTLNELHENIGTAANQVVRWNRLAEAFTARYGTKPTHIVRAPGRVNLIGEHIDYALFGVFPAAVEPDILIACSPNTDHGELVRAQNLDADKYVAQEFYPLKEGSQWSLSIDKTKLAWESYVKAGYYGVLNHFFSTAADARPLGCNLLVTGTVPAGSGLSSSAAMVVASTLAFLVINGKLDQMTKGSLVEMAMENERRVGVNSGGMDQAASVISTAQSAIYVTFHPKLAALPTRLPDTRPPLAFVIANSLVVADKVVGAKTRYNLRVVETLVSARVLADHLKIKLGSNEKVTLREVLGRWLGEEAGTELPEDKLKDGLTRIQGELNCLKYDGREGVTMDEMITLSGLSRDAFNQLYLSWVDVEATHFQLHNRAKHVFSEALRVLQFRAVAAADQDDALQQLGELMDASHASCAKLFECSCPELDQLVAICKDAGAYGSRLTGAGWGGCTVSLVAESNVDGFIQKVSQTYGPFKSLSQEKLQAIFATKPSSGACVYQFE